MHYITVYNKSHSHLYGQVLSNSVADGLKRYRQDKDVALANKFKTTESLENLVRLLNDAFDVMNSRKPIYGIRNENWQERHKANRYYYNNHILPL